MNLAIKKQWTPLLATCRFTLRAVRHLSTMPPVSKSREGEGKWGEVKILGNVYLRDSMTNVTPTIASLVDRKLHLSPQHPVNIIKQRVVQHFQKTYVSRTGNAVYAHFDDVSPVVTTEQNFDSLLMPNQHVSRSKNDNYYINEHTLLRAHTSAHQRDFIRMGFDKFLVTGDVYRRDEIDQSHYPIFHQMEGVGLFADDEVFQKTSNKSLKLFEERGSVSHVKTEDKQTTHTIDAVKMMEFNLKETLVRLVKELFGQDIEYRWNPCYFPFTHPSFELEIKFKGEWMEMLGSGIMRQEILEKGGVRDKIGWAFGLGLDRLAMLLFDISDIRILWSKDERFISQFSSVRLDPSTNIKFVPYSKYPPCYKDISFWLPSSEEGNGFHENNFYDIVRSIAGDLVERVELLDHFNEPSSGRVSHCYRITFRSMERTMTNVEVNSLFDGIKEAASLQLRVALR